MIHSARPSHLEHLSWPPAWPITWTSPLEGAGANSWPAVARLLVGCLWVVCGLIGVGTTLAQGFKKRAVCKGIEMDNQLGRNVLLSRCVCVGLIV